MATRLSAFDPVATIAAIERAGASMHLLIYQDGSGGGASAPERALNAGDMPMLGALTDEQTDALLEELWQQRKYYYAGPPPLPPRR